MAALDQRLDIGQGAIRLVNALVVGDVVSEVVLGTRRISKEGEDLWLERSHLLKKGQTHSALTPRAARYSSLETMPGMSPFPSPLESCPSKQLVSINAAKQGSTACLEGGRVDLLGRNVVSVFRLACKRGHERTW